ncbi:MAG: hypothetical protein V4436_02515 [Patescibacteria group bacterium]
MIKKVHIQFAIMMLAAMIAVAAVFMLDFEVNERLLPISSEGKWFCMLAFLLPFLAAMWVAPDCETLTQATSVGTGLGLLIYLVASDPSGRATLHAIRGPVDIDMSLAFISTLEINFAYVSFFTFVGYGIKLGIINFKGWRVRLRNEARARRLRR